MELLQVFLTSVGSVVALFVLTKIMGNRQMSQLCLFDYINGITIGSIAAEMATSLEDDFMKPLLAMIIYVAFSVLISYANHKSLKLRRFFLGKPVILYENGKIYKENLRKAKLDTSEFLTECRNNGYFNLAYIHTALLETNGKISILPLETHRPLTPLDMKFSPQQEKPIANVIMDGVPVIDNLQALKKDENWLKMKLNEQGIKNISDVFLATCDCHGQVSIYVKIEKGMKEDFFA